MKNFIKLLLTTTAILAATALVGCASTPKQQPYSPDTSAANQAKEFFTESGGKRLKGQNKVGITACNVMIATSASAHASTSSGFGEGKTANANVGMVYTIEGLSEADMHKISQSVCRQAEKKLANAGYDVVAFETLRKSENYKSMQASGKQSPFKYSKDGSKYLVFTREGDSVYDERYIGTISGLGQAFKAAAGTSAGQHEMRVIKEFGITGVHINILLDFAEVEGDGHGGIFGKKSASVAGQALLSATGSMQVYPHSGLKCWKRFGKEECEIKWNSEFNTSRSININKPFYQKVSNVTTTGDKAAAGVTKALALIGGGTSSSTTRYQVDVTPESYGSVQTVITDGFLDMAIARALEFR